MNNHNYKTKLFVYGIVFVILYFGIHSIVGLFSEYFVNSPFNGGYK